MGLRTYARYEQGQAIASMRRKSLLPASNAATFVERFVPVQFGLAMAKEPFNLEHDVRLVEANMQIANFVATRRDSRQSLEWKMSIAIWTVLLAALFKGISVLPAVTAIIPIAHGWWLQNIWTRHASDMSIMWKHVNESQRLLSRHDVELPRNRPELSRAPNHRLTDWLGFLSGWATSIQFVISTILTLSLFATVDHVSWTKLVVRP